MSSDSEFLAYPVNGGGGKGFTHTKLAGYSIMLLLVLVVAGPWISYKPAPFTGDGSPLRQYSYLLVFGLTIYACRMRDYPLRFLAIPASLAIALAYCWVSLLWSDAAGIAVRRLTLTTILIWTIFTAVRLVGFEETLKNLRIVMLGVLVLNFLVAIGLPSIGTHASGGFAETTDENIIGSWRGIMVQKNFAGAFCAVTIFTYIFCNRDMRPLLKWAVIIGSFLFLYKTNSKTSMGLVIMSTVLGFAFMRYHPKFRVLVLPLTILIIGIVALLAILNWEIVTAPFQDEDAFTGRIQIWPVLLAYWQDHVWLGAGYGSFWNIGASSPLFSYVSANNWVGDLGNGHNGYIDLLITLGLPGLILILACVIFWPMIKLFSTINIPGERRGYLLAMILFSSLHNLTETSLFERDTIMNIFLMFALALLEVAGRKKDGTEAVEIPSQTKIRSNRPLTL